MHDVRLSKACFFNGGKLSWSYVLPVVDAVILQWEFG